MPEDNSILSLGIFDCDHDEGSPARDAPGPGILDKRSTHLPEEWVFSAVRQQQAQRAIQAGR
jgi:hypothetical protein